MSETVTRTLKDVSHTPPTGEPVQVWDRGPADD